MILFSHLTERETLRCSEVAAAFSEQDELWAKYRNVQADIAGIDFDLEISSEPANNYIVFVGNIVRQWLRENAPDVEASHLMFSCFHQLIERKAEAAAP